MTYLQPFTRMLDFTSGKFLDPAVVQRRHLADLQGLFADPQAETALMASNPLLYEVYEATDNPIEAGQLRYSTTIIYPGKVGDEYYMTKGHYHAKGECAELYFGLQGEGLLLLQTPEGEINAQPMTPGAAAYVPPFWGHRTINVGTQNFVFFACYPAEAGYDYQRIAEKGFASLVVERNGTMQLVPNPRWKR
jgi:glucose-6-phosphate isomerase, archaeal